MDATIALPTTLVRRPPGRLGGPAARQTHRAPAIAEAAAIAVAILVAVAAAIIAGAGAPGPDDCLAQPVPGGAGAAAFTCVVLREPGLDVDRMIPR